MHPLLLGAILVRALVLPPHATIDPIGARSLMAASGDGRIAATVQIDGYERRVVAWNRDGGKAFVVAGGTLAGFDSDGALLVNNGSPVRVLPNASRALDLRTCEDFPQSSVGPIVAGALSDGTIVATMQSPPIVDLDDTSGQYAPVVLVMRSNLCSNLGNGIALATAGAFAAGYTATIANVPAPSNVASARERFTAMRWHARSREPIGAGVAIAIAGNGDVAGADVPPGLAYGTPHARAWLGNAAVDVAPNAPLSVAYAIDARGRVAGAVEDGSKRHYAFVWQSGRLERLDDVARSAGWRFECAYAFAPDGSVLGIGTFRGRPTAFRLWGL